MRSKDEQTHPTQPATRDGLRLVEFELPPATLARAEKLAHAQGVSVEEITRRALQAELAKR